MNKSLRIVSIIVIVLVLSFGIFYILNNAINLKTSELNLIHEFSADLTDSRVYNLTKRGKGSSLTQCITPFYFDATMVNTRTYLAGEYGILLPEMEFDFDKYGMVVSIGRQVEEIKYYDGGFNEHTAHITFGSEYTKWMVYVYQMDRFALKGELMDGNYYYVMNGDKREFAGRSMSTVNSYIDSMKD